MPITKPPHGSPCNSCGVCCKTILCPIGVATFKQRQGPCPAIEINKENLPSCGLVNRPDHYVPLKTIQYGIEKLREAALLLIASGKGCDYYAAGEPTSSEFYKRMIEDQINHKSRYERAKFMWEI